MEDPPGQPVPECVDGGVQGPAAGEQGQSASARRGDQSFDLIVTGVQKSFVPRIGQRGGAVEEGLVGEVERTAHIFEQVLMVHQAQTHREIRRHGGACQHDGAFPPEALVEHPGHVDRCHLEGRAIGRAFGPRHLLSGNRAAVEVKGG